MNGRLSIIEILHFIFIPFRMTVVLFLTFRMTRPVILSDGSPKTFMFLGHQAKNLTQEKVKLIEHRQKKQQCFTGGPSGTPVPTKTNFFKQQIEILHFIFIPFRMTGFKKVSRESRRNLKYAYSVTIKKSRESRRN